MAHETEKKFSEPNYGHIQHLQLKENPYGTVSGCWTFLKFSRKYILFTKKKRSKKHSFLPKFWTLAKNIFLKFSNFFSKFVIKSIYIIKLHCEHNGQNNGDRKSRSSTIFRKSVISMFFTLSKKHPQLRRPKKIFGH